LTFVLNVRLERDDRALGDEIAGLVGAVEIERERAIIAGNLSSLLP